jgi:hypothetical protein
LRASPVRRDEVRFKHAYFRKYELLTMPLGTFRREERARPGRSYMTSWLVGDAGLWQALWDEVSADLAAKYARELRYCEEHPDYARIVGRPSLTKLQPFELREHELGNIRAIIAGSAIWALS